MAFSHTYDIATPDGDDDPAEADNRMREIKAAVQERENVDHYWPKTGTKVSDADTGEHRKVTLRTGSAPTKADDKGFVYAKDVDGKAELFYIDEDGDEVQLTSGGKILSASLDMKDEDDMSSDSASHAATQQSIKAFGEAIDSADDFTPTSYAGEESVTLPNGLIIKTGSWSGTLTKGSNQDVTYAVAFPTDVRTVNICITGGPNVLGTPIITLSSPTTKFNIKNAQTEGDLYSGGTITSFRWEAIGY